MLREQLGRARARGPLLPPSVSTLYCSPRQHGDGRPVHVREPSCSVGQRIEHQQPLMAIGMGAESEDDDKAPARCRGRDPGTVQDGECDFARRSAIELRRPWLPTARTRLSSPSSDPTHATTPRSTSRQQQSRSLSQAMQKHVQCLRSYAAPAMNGVSTTRPPAGDFSAANLIVQLASLCDDGGSRECLKMSTNSSAPGV